MSSPPGHDPPDIIDQMGTMHIDETYSGPQVISTHHPGIDHGFLPGPYPTLANKASTEDRTYPEYGQQVYHASASTGNPIPENLYLETPFSPISDTPYGASLVEGPGALGPPFEPILYGAPSSPANMNPIEPFSSILMRMDMPNAPPPPQMMSPTMRGGVLYPPQHPTGPPPRGSYQGPGIQFTQTESSQYIGFQPDGRQYWVTPQGKYLERNHAPQVSTRI